MGNILEEINEIIPSMIKNCLEVNTELAVACEGLYKFFLFLINQITKEISVTVDESVKHKCASINE